MIFVYGSLKAFLYIYMAPSTIPKYCKCGYKAANEMELSLQNHLMLYNTIAK